MEWCEKTWEELEAKGYLSGLSDEEAEKVRKRTGTNIWTKSKRESWLVRFFAQWKDFMILTLVCAAVVSAAASYFNGELSLIDPLVILAIITVNAVLGLVQESRAEKALDALKRLSAPTVQVRRNGQFQVRPATDLVEGDVILLEAGGYVPADARLLEAVNLRVDESSLTGESMPVEKDAKRLVSSQTPIADRVNMVLAGTLVVQGRGCAFVTATGMRTETGKIARQMMEEVPPPTPLQKRLDETGKKLGLGALLICVLVFLIGAFRNLPLFHLFMVSVSLAVAAIPEGLSAVVTIMLSLGVRRMAKANAIIRRLPAVETLGSTTVICSDKTGTLTQNRMVVRMLSNAGGVLERSGEEGRRLLAYVSLCCDAFYDKDQVIGEATEAAIVRAAREVGVLKDRWEERYPRIDEIPFDSVRKCMTTVHKDLFGSEGILVKGAAEVIIPKCKYYDAKGTKAVLTETMRTYLIQNNEQMAEQALRVIAVAWRKVERKDIGRKDSYEKNLVFGGLIGMMDPPRPEAKEAIALCHSAGIRVVMITGDHVKTACAVANELGILEGAKRAMTGQELEQLSDQELKTTIASVDVFARVAPEHKVRVVRALQRKGEVVAMTGDGVNDAPALKAADIGCAMGVTGTDVAKNTADMILADDNFATIVSAVREGRIIYDNIRKAIHFLLATNVGEIICIFLAVMLGFPSPLVAVQLLWVNLVTDSLPAVAIGMEPAEPGLMNRKPLPPNTGMFADGMGWEIFWEGCMIGGLTLVTFWLAGKEWGILVARSMAFGVLSLTELFHAVNMRSEESLLRIGFGTNRVMLVALALCVGLQLAVMTITPIASIFQVVPLDGKQWAIMLGVSLIPVIIMEIQKNVRYVRSK
ncbi:MAG: calcium-translocating P-type ATPase, PMCA-type [Lachnospiraceae bacterium]|nr:calcium-translocating P-type ATPase, PMCA-type [Lachnospiraceae bacterium]